MNTYQEESEFFTNKYRLGFEALQKAILLGEKLMDTSSKSTVNKESDYIAWMFFNSMFNKMRASQLLLERGFAVEAQVLARSLIENFINLFYLKNNLILDSEDLAERFGNYQYFVIPYNYSKKYKYIDAQLSKLLIYVNEDGYNNFRKKYPDGIDTDWSGKNWDIKAEGGQVVDSYRYTYPILSAVSHGSADALNDLIQEDGSTSGFIVEPHDKGIPETINLICDHFLRAIDQIATFMALSPIREEVSALRNENEIIFKNVKLEEQNISKHRIVGIISNIALKKYLLNLARDRGVIISDENIELSDINSKLKDELIYGDSTATNIQDIINIAEAYSTNNDLKPTKEKVQELVENVLEILHITN